MTGIAERTDTIIHSREWVPHGLLWRGRQDRHTFPMIYKFYKFRAAALGSVILAMMAAGREYFEGRVLTASKIRSAIVRLAIIH